MGVIIHDLPYIDPQESPTIVLEEERLDSVVAPDFESETAEWIQDNGPDWACVALNMFGPYKASRLLLEKRC